MAIFALNIMPYISASIIIQLLTTVAPTLEALKKEGEAGRKVLNQYTRYLHRPAGAVPGLRHRRRSRRRGSTVVIEPGLFFRVSTVITLVGGTMFLMWLGEQITARGIGNGISLIICAGIVADLPSAIAGTLELGRQGALSTGFIICVAGHGDRRWSPSSSSWSARSAGSLVQYPKRQVGNQHVRGPVLASAAQAQHLRRHPADLRVVAAAAAGDDRAVPWPAGPRIGCSGSIDAARRTAGRCISCSTSR